MNKGWQRNVLCWRLFHSGSFLRLLNLCYSFAHFDGWHVEKIKNLNFIYLFYLFFHHVSTIEIDRSLIMRRGSKPDFFPHIPTQKYDMYNNHSTCNILMGNASALAFNDTLASCPIFISLSHPYSYNYLLGLQVIWKIVCVPSVSDMK